MVNCRHDNQYRISRIQEGFVRSTKLFQQVILAAVCETLWQAETNVYFSPAVRRDRAKWSGGETTSLHKGEESQIVVVRH